MEQIDLSVSAAEKLRVATEYANQLFEGNPKIDAIVATGSVVRGDSIPPSDVDMWCITSGGSGAPTAQRGVRRGVMVDIEPVDLGDPAVEGVLSDAYALGYLSDAVVLLDRSDVVSQRMAQIKAMAAEPTRKARRLARLVVPIRRNVLELNRAALEDNASEVCRSSIFVIWCLADYLAARVNLSPGGLRVLSRLKARNPQAYQDAIQPQSLMTVDHDRVRQLLLLYEEHAPESEFGLPTVRWMVGQGLGDEAFHLLWILLGLQVKDHRSSPPWLQRLCRTWLLSIGWTTEALPAILSSFDVSVAAGLGGDVPGGG